MAIYNPDEKRLRALMMLEFRLKNGAEYSQIAKEFNVSERTVIRTLTWVRKAGLVAEAEDKILQELVPAAHTALVKALASPDPKVAGKLAIEIFKGTISGFKKEAKTTVSATGGDDLDTYLNQLRSESANANAIDGETVESSAQRALTAGSPEDAPQGDVEPDRRVPDGNRPPAGSPPPVGLGSVEGASVPTE